MKPHLAHIQNTLIKKKLAEKAANVDKPMEEYRELIAKARAAGYDDLAIITELQAERFRIKTDTKYGDSLFMKGVQNAQAACIVAIDQLIAELKESE